jgi:DNA-binding GntR family transcriptional regulator
VGWRSFLLGHFHVCLAECLGNQLLADTLRDFTARTTLIAMLYQSSHDAEKSCQEHIEIVHALERGDKESAERLMAEHIGQMQSALQINASPADPLAELRQALASMRPLKKYHPNGIKEHPQNPFLQPHLPLT